MPQARSKPDEQDAPKRAAKAKIEKETDLAWWCPLCDTSMSLLVETCGGCGAVRDGDSVRKP